MNHKLRLEMYYQKIDTSADIIFGSLTLLEGFVILDLKETNFTLTTKTLTICNGVTCKVDDLL